MSTSKPYHGADPLVMFKAPTIGPHMYLVVATISTWPEAFDRKTADKALAAFVEPLDMDTILSTFDTNVQLEERALNWADVIGFLARITQRTNDLVPTNVGVAFWAHYLLWENQQGTN
jgi:hypothetical protein